MTPTHANGIAGRYLWVWLLGIAVGWFEAAVVVYLRELYYPDGFTFPLVIITGRIAVVEVVREAASILLLAAAARLAGRHFLQRFAALMILFGVWDLVYYGVLKLVLGWPESLLTWDILFLIPLPWVGPVWAPCVVSVALVAVGSYLFWTPQRARAYRPRDWAIASLGGAIVILSFLAEWRVVIEERVPETYPAWLFWIGFLLSLLWFLHAERRTRLSAVAMILGGAVLAPGPPAAVVHAYPGRHQALATSAQDTPVTTQYVIGVSAEDYLAADARWRADGYHPAVLSAISDVRAGEGYSGVWHRSPPPLETMTAIGLSPDGLAEQMAARADEGYRVLDLDAVVVDGVPAYAALWVQDPEPIEHHVHAQLSRDDLEAKIMEYAQEGYGPVRIAPYRLDGATSYAAVWIRDRLGYKVAVDLTEVGYHDTDRAAVEQGFTAVEVSWHDNRGDDFFGVWVDDPSVAASQASVGLTQEQVEQLNARYREEGYRLVSLAAYHPPLGDLSYAAIWQRPSPPETP